MDFITREQARADIVDLRLPQIVLDAFDAKPLPHNLDDQFREPYMMFTLGPAEQAEYGQGHITPIWTGNGDYTIVAYDHDPTRSGFFRYDIEAPGEAHAAQRLSWQQVLVAEFKFLWESEWPDERLADVASWFDFKHIEPLIKDLRSSNLDTFEKDAAWYAAFL